MKKLILAAFALTTAASVFAQGTVNFANRFSGEWITHVWGPGTVSTLSVVGIGSNDLPTGSTFVAPAGSSMIGAAGTAGHYGGATTLAQLLDFNGTTANEALLVAAGQTTTFRTGAAQGNAVLTVSTLSNIPANVSGNGTGPVTLEMVAWDASTPIAGYDLTQWGTFTVGAQTGDADQAWMNGLIAAGKSGLFSLSSAGAGNVSVPNLTPNSFNLYFVSVPEPTSFALLGLGAAAMLIFRRRK
jgi:hypothetical protein